MQIFKLSDREPFSTRYGEIPWYTWSDALLNAMDAVGKDIDKLTPSLQFIPGFNDYNYTYTHLQYPTKLKQKLEKYAEALYAFPLSHEVAFLPS